MEVNLPAIPAPYVILGILSMVFCIFGGIFSFSLRRYDINCKNKEPQGLSVGVCVFSVVSAALCASGIIAVSIKIWETI